MSRTRKKPTYDAERIMQEFIETVADAFGEYDDRYRTDSGDKMNNSRAGLNAVAAEFGITALKARKLLITAGAYSTATSRKIAGMMADGKSIQQMMEITGLSRASVHSYLPYTKIPYKLEELSVNAERTKLYRERKAACEKFVNEIDGKPQKEQDIMLWEMLKYLQGCTFFTAKKLRFTYKIKGGEMFVNRKEKSITQSTVFMAFHKALELGDKVAGPKMLGTFGASYLYPVFIRLGII